MLDQANFRKLGEPQGYTLIETLIAVSLCGFLLVFSLQSYQFIKMIFETRAVLHRIIDIVYYVRSEAILQGRSVTICKSQDGKSCSGHWSDGQIVFTDEEKPHVLHVFGPVKTGRLYLHAFQSNDFLRFMASGVTSEQNGSFIYCPSHNPRLARALIIEKSGRIRLSQDADHDGVYEDSEGLPLYCSEG